VKLVGQGGGAPNAHAGAEGTCQRHHHTEINPSPQKADRIGRGAPTTSRTTKGKTLTVSWIQRTLGTARLTRITRPMQTATTTAAATGTGFLGKVLIDTQQE